MTTFRIRHTQCYTSIANSAIQDKRLSFKARGLHHLLLSYPNNWEVNAKHLVEQSDKDGRDAIYNALKELAKFGYIRKIKHRKAGGQFQSVSYDVFESPNTVNPETVQPHTGLPDTGKPDTGLPDTGNPYAYKRLNSTKNLIDQRLTLNKGECDASLELSQAAAQRQEELSPDQKTGQLENPGQDPPGEKSSAAPSLEYLKVTLNQLSSDYVPDALRHEWRMGGKLPWRDKRTGDIPEPFAVFVGKKLMFKGDRESMSPLEKGRRHIRNAEATVSGMQGVIDSWSEFSRQNAARHVVTAKASSEVIPAPMPADFKEKFKEAQARRLLGHAS